MPPYNPTITGTASLSTSTKGKEKAFSAPFEGLPKATRSDNQGLGIKPIEGYWSD